jgi:hypothetical protein
MKKFTRFLFLGTALLISVVAFTSCKKNAPPVVASVLVNPTAVDPGQTATITVTATDADSDPLTYTYTPNGGAVSGSGSSVQWIAPSTAGAFSVAVTVSDGQGGSATGTGNLTVNQVIVFTGVSGTAKFLAGTAGDLSNSKISLYTSLDAWNINSPIKFGAVTGSGASVTFRLSANPGNYYLDIWKDNDNNGLWSTGDFVGWHGSGGLGSPALTEVQLQPGQNFSSEITMYIF